MKRIRRTYLDISTFVESFGHILLSKDYEIVDKKGFVKSKTKIHIECNNNHKFYTCFDVYKNGKFKCKKCAQESGHSARKYTFEDIVGYFGDEGYRVTSLKTSYRNMETVLDVICPRGHEWTSSYNNFKSGYKCPKCKIEDNENSNYIEDEQRLLQHGYKVLDFKRAINDFYTNSIFVVKCVNGHITTKTVNSIRANKLVCVDCLGKKKKTLDEVVGIFESYGYCVLSHNGYENNQSRFLISCKNGHKYDTTYASFQQRDKQCSFCDNNSVGVSKGEKKIAKFLDQINVEYIYQYKIEECRVNLPLPFDFYLPDYNILIEYDGVQHFVPVARFGGLDKFIAQKIRDTIKNDYTNKNNIPLIRIPYWDFDNIEEILNKKIYGESSTTIPQGSTL